MPSDCIPFRETNYFSSFICDYLDEKPELKEFYHRFPKLDNFKDQLQEKQQSFPSENRKVLKASLSSQYKNVDISEATQKNIDLLDKDTTFTVTTGHQLNLFTGPLYFLYKIVSTINLTSVLKEKHPEYDFVPIYWMATEDHDFDEINYFNFKGKKIQWNRKDGGAVGVFDTEGLDKVFEIFSSEIGSGRNAERLKSLFREAYLKHNNLADATRYLANELFRDYGLVIVDADDKELKRLFIPYVKRELEEQVSYNTVLPKAEKLEAKGYKVQVNPREINLFYLSEGSRERIIEKEGSYFVNDTEISWSKSGLLKELSEFPERFSPNVMMRPLYQEVILPNLCYIGGGGELAYWLELKDYFEAVQIPFPMLLLRNSVLIKTEKQADKIKRLVISDTELFLKQHELINRKVRQISNIDINFDPQRKVLKEQFEGMYELAKQTDVTFVNAVKAQEVKQLKGLDVLEKRLLKAQRIKLSDHVQRLTTIQNELFPNQSLQERNTNFSEMYLEYGEELISELIKQLDPLCGEFVVLNM
ncbi:bacillithiol biosynthesis cysteine-adding enzyme BshC [Aquimarina sp. BL5]|uniref:bacillithiol biosynthesis cysteine-adding enzyme BshC n=1 Tax=Aquimarina sp. BL5 TaxID=1714860 RepID=UPI000E504AAB|nr:bacillithiol biosynthesis cysteine-adding enzyme BshC [Aquimarina sp. BL5]AXT53349.1 bacillithiol biosynthesis cysteine-adding enzyme BshC [Aquimarina sp. BL5]RKN06190.1 bacillithiol biosynthesis cysteine-adding enzyme BshC [Aquimarina sp. BL5]